MICKPGTVVRVPFPFIDSPHAKHRPALVVSQERFQKAHRAVVLAMITSARHSAWPSDVAISDQASAGLSAPSIVRFKVFTLDERLVGDPLGRLGRKDWAAVQTALRSVLGV